MIRLFGRKQKIESGLQKTRSGLFGRILGILDKPTVSDDVWDALEEALIAADVGAKLAIDILARIKERVKKEGARDGTAVQAILKDEMLRVLNVAGKPSLLAGEEKIALPAKPYVVLMIGVNGVGKTTSIAKIGKLLTDKGVTVLLAAGDTFRAAGAEQLEIWAKRINVEVVSHQSGGDPGAVAFDALQAAKARGSDVVIIDTAGRLHTKTNLMEELKKVQRVIQRFDAKSPHETILVLDATTGQNGLAQAKSFAEAIGVTGIMLAKLDGTAKGGIAFAIADQLKLPIVFVGTGEQTDDIAAFSAADFVDALFAREV